MAENPYTRSINVQITEFVPERDQLPRCHGWKLDGAQCRNTAKYEMDGHPTCAVHIKPGSMFTPEKWVRDE